MAKGYGAACQHIRSRLAIYKKQTPVSEHITRHPKERLVAVQAFQRQPGAGIYT
jgi:hypothetical protein